MDGLDPWMVQDFKGQGSQVVRILPLMGPALVMFEAAGGRGHVAVKGLGSNGRLTWMPVNDVGPYRGVHLHPGSKEVVAFEVSSGSSWALAVRPLGDARRWFGGAINGDHPDVLLIPDGVRKFSTVDFSVQAGKAAAVWALSDETRKLLFNQVGPFSGQCVLPMGTLLVAVEHAGPWSMNWQ